MSDDWDEHRAKVPEFRERPATIDEVEEFSWVIFFLGMVTGAATAVGVLEMFGGLLS